MTASWLREANGRVTLTLHIQPGAKTTMLSGVHGDALKIRLAAPPVDGKANAALCDFLAGCLLVPKRDVEVIGGLTSRQKRVAIYSTEATMPEKIRGLLLNPSS